MFSSPVCGLGFWHNGVGGCSCIWMVGYAFEARRDGASTAAMLAGRPSSCHRVFLCFCVRCACNYSQTELRSVEFGIVNRVPERFGDGWGGLLRWIVLMVEAVLHLEICVYVCWGVPHKAARILISSARSLCVLHDNDDDDDNEVLLGSIGASLLIVYVTHRLVCLQDKMLGTYDSGLNWLQVRQNFDIGLQTRVPSTVRLLCFILVCVFPRCKGLLCIRIMPIATHGLINDTNNPSSHPTNHIVSTPHSC